MKKKTTHLCYTIRLIWGTALLIVNTVMGQAPWIEIPPVSQAVAEGSTAYLSVSVSGALPITYTWHRNFESTNFYKVTLNSTNCTLALPNMTPADACFFNLDTKNSFGYGPGKQVIVAVISSGMATNGFALTIRGLTNSVWTINYSTNLTSPNWLNLTNLSIPRNPSVFKFVDLEATNLSRFYQVIPTVQ